MHVQAAAMTRSSQQASDQMVTVASGIRANKHQDSSIFLFFFTLMLPLYFRIPSKNYILSDLNFPPHKKREFIRGYR